jgi:biopolymer transport protein ExbB
MCRRKLIDFAFPKLAFGSVLAALAVGFAAGADDPARHDFADPHSGHEAHAQAVGTEVERILAAQIESATALARRGQRWLTAWYRTTPPADRVTWGGMIAAACLALGVFFERLVRLQKHKIVPPEFTARFLDRLHEGKLDGGQSLDHCEMNPSPAARVALAAVRRWGRPPADLERAVALAHRVESEHLRRNVGTLRRVAALTPLLGLLGTLFAVGRVLEGMPVAAPIHVYNTALISQPASDTQLSIAWGPPLAAALTPLSVGIIIASLALVAYDGLLTRVETLAGALDRLGAETIDAIAMAAPVSTPTITLAHPAARSPVVRPNLPPEPLAVPARTPHQPWLRPQVRADSAARPRTVDEQAGF